MNDFEKIDGIKTKPSKTEWLIPMKYVNLRATFKHFS